MRPATIREARADALLEAARALEQIGSGATLIALRAWLIERSRCERLGVVEEAS